MFASGPSGEKGKPRIPRSGSLSDTRKTENFPARVARPDHAALALVAAMLLGEKRRLFFARMTFARENPSRIRIRASLRAMRGFAHTKPD